VGGEEERDVPGEPESAGADGVDESIDSVGLEGRPTAETVDLGAGMVLPPPEPVLDAARPATLPPDTLEGIRFPINPLLSDTLRREPELGMCPADLGSRPGIRFPYSPFLLGPPAPVPGPAVPKA
jgi:hypothetical protein